MRPTRCAGDGIGSRKKARKISLITKIISTLPSRRARFSQRAAAAVKDSYFVRLLFAVGTPIAAAMIVQQLLTGLPIWLGKYERGSVQISRPSTFSSSVLTISGTRSSLG